MNMNEQSVSEAFNEHQPLLYKIAFHFGLDSQEACKLVRLADSSFVSNDALNKDHGLYKLAIAKSLIRACIFKISAELFSKPKYYVTGSTTLQDRCELTFQDMPLSFKAVYILCTTTDFTDKEIAEVLNITPVVVRQRLSKARCFISHHCLRNY